MARRNLRNLQLGAIAAVDNPCQEHAKAVILKRRTDVPPPPPPASDPTLLAIAVGKYVGCEDGAHTFNEVLSENKFSEAIWPMTDALSQSIRSIMGDEALKPNEREAKITSSVDQFLGAIRQLDPPVEAGEDAPIAKVEKQLWELIRKKDEPMPKTIEELTAKVGELTGQLSSANALTTTLTARAEKAEGELATEKAAHVETKKSLVAATDETIEVGGQQIKKSEVGEAQFMVTKALREERDMARLEKSAAEDFGHLPGTPTEKALVLKAVGAMPEEARKSLQTIMTAAEKMAAGAFGTLGYRGDTRTETEKASVATFEAKVAEIAKRDNVNQATAMTKARTEFPTEFAAAYPQG